MKKRPDVELRTGVRARELRFGRVPKTRLRFEGEPGHDSRSTVERDNLPAEVEAGVVYRDVGVCWTVEQRIVHPSDDHADSHGEPESEGRAGESGAEG